ncbi:unnamed protein product [Amoebophrya sp. A25]|nr:unnamed protein product [Amoebophrya sp. A25]|eukprot:GSA25T00010973001.1
MVGTSSRCILLLVAGATGPGVAAVKRVKPHIQKRSFFQKWVSGPAVAAAALSSGASADRPTTFSETQAQLQHYMLDPVAMTDAFHNFAASHGKPYVSAVEAHSSADNDGKHSEKHQFGFVPAPGLEEEYQNRKKVFEDNVLRAIAQNTDSKMELLGKNRINRDGSVPDEFETKLARFGVTKFMDLKPEEFAHFYLGMRNMKRTEKKALMDNMEKEDVRLAISSDRFLPKESLLPTETKDWRDADVITDVKDQGQCGSCWAFSTVEQVESMARVEGITTDFVGAPQELVSCDHNGDMGCNGGLPTNAFDWLEDKPLEAEVDYPYMSGITRETGKCKADFSEGKIKVTSFKSISEDEKDPFHTGEKKMIKYVLQSGPLSLGVDAQQWQLYSGGVMSATSCAAEQLDHAVQAVAYYGDAEEPYWVVRNSWNTDWGEEGFIRLAAGENACMMAGMATTVSVETVDPVKTVETPGPRIEEVPEDMVV